MVMSILSTLRGCTLGDGEIDIDLLTVVMYTFMNATPGAS